MTHKAPLLDPLTADERLSADDMATRREAEHLADSLAVQQLRAAHGEVYTRGTCANCGATCLPQAVYCDRDCRADHETRLQRLARQRKTVG